MCSTRPGPSPFTSPPMIDDHFLFDIESVQQCATAMPLKLAQYHYGGMAFRGNLQWFREKDDHSIRPGDLQSPEFPRSTACPHSPQQAVFLLRPDGE